MMIWSPNVNGSYTSKSAYSWLLHQRLDDDLTIGWAWIWRMKSLENKKFLLQPITRFLLSKLLFVLVVIFRRRIFFIASEIVFSLSGFGEGWVLRSLISFITLVMCSGFKHIPRVRTIAGSLLDCGVFGMLGMIFVSTISEGPCRKSISQLPLCCSYFHHLGSVERSAEYSIEAYA